MAVFRDPLPDDPAFDEPPLIGMLPDDMRDYYRQREVECNSPRWYVYATNAITQELLARLLVQFGRIADVLEKKCP